MKQDAYVVYYDDQSAIDLSKNATYHSRTKHIEVRYHWICDAIEMKLFQLKKIHTDKNVARHDNKSHSKEEVGVLFQARWHGILLRIQVISSFRC